MGGVAWVSLDGRVTSAHADRAGATGHGCFPWPGWLSAPGPDGQVTTAGSAREDGQAGLRGPSPLADSTRRGRVGHCPLDVRSGNDAQT